MKRYLAFLLITCLAGGALAGGLKVAAPSALSAWTYIVDGLTIGNDTQITGTQLHVSTAGVTSIARWTTSTTGLTNGDGFEIALGASGVDHNMRESRYQRWLTGGVERMRMLSGGVIGVHGVPASTAAGLEVMSALRVSGNSLGPTTGVGIELAYLAPDSYLISYNRDGAAYAPLIINGAPTQINPNTAYVDIGGQTKIRQYASSDMRVAAPQAAGYYATNITAFKLCIASGTGAGAWVDPTDGTTACD